MLTPRDGYSFADFQYEGEKIIDQRKRFPITSRKLSSKGTERICNDLFSRYHKYGVSKEDISQVIYYAEHPCGNFYHEGRITFGTGVNIHGGALSGEGMLSNVSMHHSTIKARRSSESSIAYFIANSDIGSTMFFLEPDSVIVDSHVGCSTIINGKNVIRFGTLTFVTLKGDNEISSSDIENCLIVDSDVHASRVKGFSESLIIANAAIRFQDDVFEICRYNLETKRKEGGLLYRTKDKGVAFSTPDYGVKILANKHRTSKITYYIEKLYEGSAKKRNELITGAQDFIEKVFDESQ